MSHEHRQLILRLLGSTATIGGSMASGLAPGRLEIRIGGVIVGRGRSLAVAIQEAATVLSVVVRLQSAARKTSPSAGGVQGK